MMFVNWGLDVQAWSDAFMKWRAFMIGDEGVLRGPLIAFLAVSIVGYAIYYVTTSGGILFGSFHPKVRRDNRVAFEGAGTVWGSDRELQELLAMGNYQKLSGKATSTDYVSADEEGNEVSKIRVTRWSSD
jgi:hypothetical protein